MEKNTLESALKEFSQTSGTNANDVKEFFALMSDGSIKRMPKEDMASVLGGLNFESQYKSLATSLAVYTIPGDYYFTMISDSNIPSGFNKSFVHLRVRGYSKNIFQEIRSLISPNVVYIRSKTSANEFGEWIKMY